MIGVGAVVLGDPVSAKDVALGGAGLALAGRAAMKAARLTPDNILKTLAADASFEADEQQQVAVLLERGIARAGAGHR